jgi:hypothetical protein
MPAPGTTPLLRSAQISNKISSRPLPRKRPSVLVRGGRGRKCRQKVVRFTQSQIPRKNDAFSAPPGTGPIGTRRTETPLQNRCPRLMSRTPLPFSFISCLLKGVGVPHTFVPSSVNPRWSWLLSNLAEGFSKFASYYSSSTSSHPHVPPHVDTIQPQFFSRDIVRGVGRFHLMRPLLNGPIFLMSTSPSHHSLHH